MIEPGVPSQQEQEPPTPSRGRDVVENGADLWISRAVRIVGLGIAVYETVVEHTDRPTLLGTALVMMVGTIAYDAVRRRLS